MATHRHFQLPGRSLVDVEVRILETEGSPMRSMQRRQGNWCWRTSKATPSIPRHNRSSGPFFEVQKVHLETYRSRLSPAVEDSLREASAAFEMVAMGKGGRRSELRVHWKPGSGTPDLNGVVQEHDEEQLYG